MDESIAVFRLFCKGLHKELTINQIAKGIEKSYSFTNKIVKELITQNLLYAKAVGHSILCRANYQNPITKLYLALSSALEAGPALKALSQEKQKQIATIFGVLKNDTLSAVLIHNQLYLIRKEEAIVGGDFHAISKSHFKEFVKQYGIENITIIIGYEAFWELIGEHFD